MTYENGVLSLDIDIDTGDNSLEVTIEGDSSGRLPYYDGVYEVDPRKVRQTLETANKSMHEDVIVKPIYYAETSNEGGGYTAIIGLE